MPCALLQVHAVCGAVRGDPGAVGAQARYLTRVHILSHTFALAAGESALSLRTSLAVSFPADLKSFKPKIGVCPSMPNLQNINYLVWKKRK
jgi:hypothetical protein